MPDGTVLTDVPIGITQNQLWARYTAMLTQQGEEDAQQQAAMTPIDRALATRAQDVGAFQAKTQDDWAKWRAGMQEQDKQHPEFAPNPLVADPMPEVRPHLETLRPSLAAREDKPQMGSGFKATFNLGLLEDPETKRRVLAQTLFPNDPDGYYRVGFDADGQPVYVGDDNKLHKIASGTASFGAHLAANSPEMTFGALGALAGPGGAALGAAGAHSIKRSIAGLIFDEPQTWQSNLAGMAKEAGYTLAGEGLGRLTTGAINAGRELPLTRSELKAAEATRARILGNTGIDLDIAQAAGKRRLTSMKAYLGRYPGESADIIEASDLRGQAQMHARTKQVLDQIAAPEPSRVSGRSAINVADKVIRSEKQAASARVGPLFRAAWDEVPVVTDPEILQFLKLPHFQEAFDRGQRIAALDDELAPTQLLTETSWTRTKEPGTAFYKMTPTQTPTKITTPDLRSLDYTKRGLSDVIGRLLKQDGGRDEARALITQKDAFTAALDNIANPKYRVARQAWQKELRTNIEPLENGLVGTLAGIEDRQARKAAGLLFNDANLDSQMVRDAKQVIQKKSPQAWNGIVRSWIQRQWNLAQRTTQTGYELNAAGKFHQRLFGTPDQRETTLAMLDPAAADSMEKLMEAAQKLASTPVAGSNTARDLAMESMLKTATGRVKKVARWIMSFRKSTIDAIDRNALENGTKEVAEAMTDPAKRKRLSVIMKMQPSTRQAILMASVIGAQTAKDFALSQSAQGENSNLVIGEPNALGQ